MAVRAGVRHRRPVRPRAVAGGGRASAGYPRASPPRRRRPRRQQGVPVPGGVRRRVLTPSVTRATAGNGTVGILLDPPYSTGTGLYAEHKTGLADEVRQWCSTAPADYRIVLAGYEDDHDALFALGWRKEAGRSGGGAGYSTNPNAGRRERLWLSPACLGEDLFSHWTAAHPSAVAAT